MAQAHIAVVERFAVPPGTLFEALVDHEGMSAWLGAKVTVLRGDGGVGTVRRLHLGPVVLDEEITYADAPRRLVYRVVRGDAGLLRFHRGEVVVEAWGRTGSTVRWDVLLDTVVPGASRPLELALGAVLRRGLRRLRDRFAAEELGVAPPAGDGDPRVVDG
ncbi:MAG: SRPBCC family protein [Sandaracinaceae bacterium]